MRQNYRNRISEIEEQRRIKVEEQILKKEAARQEKLRQQVNYTKEIVYHGLWQNELEVPYFFYIFDHSKYSITLYFFPK